MIDTGKFNNNNMEYESYDGKDLKVSLKNGETITGYCVGIAGKFEYGSQPINNCTQIVYICPDEDKSRIISIKTSDFEKVDIINQKH